MKRLVIPVLFAIVIGCQTTPPGDLDAIVMIQPPDVTHLDPSTRSLLEKLGEATPIRHSGPWSGDASRPSG